MSEIRKVKVHFLRDDIVVSVEWGTLLQEAMILAGLWTAGACNTPGECAKCMVEIRRPGERWWRTVKVCETQVITNLEIHGYAWQNRINAEEADSDETAWLQSFAFTIGQDAPEQISDDWSRLKRALEQVTGQAEWKADIPLIARLGKLINNTSGSLYATVSPDRVIDLQTGRQPAFMVAFDVGTTSIAATLLCGTDRRIIAAEEVVNPLIRTGTDVIRLAKFAYNSNLDKLSARVRSAMDALIEKLCIDAGIYPGDILAVSVVGNTCMHHLFLGLSTDSLICMPYRDSLRTSMVLSAADYGLHVHPAAPLLLPPLIGGFVGSDMAASMLAVDWERTEEPVLLLDIGTSVEIVLKHGERTMACSVVASAVFAGHGIQSGMQMEPGAVYHVEIVDGKIVYHINGGGKAKGLSGSGLIDLVSVLRRRGKIDRSGRMIEDPEFRLEKSEVVLTQRDVREVQMAKSAVSAAIQLLADRMNLELGAIRQVYFSESSGHINPDSACDLGLIPPVFRDRIVSVGNAAISGARMVLQNRDLWQQVEKRAAETEYLNLAMTPAYQDAILDAVDFPELNG